MYLFCLLFIVTNVAMCADQSLVRQSSLLIPSTPPQDIKGRHFRKVSVVLQEVNSSNVSLSQKISCVQEIKKDTPLRASQDDNEDEPIFKMDQ